MVIHIFAVQVHFFSLGENENEILFNDHCIFI